LLAVFFIVFLAQLLFDEKPPSILIAEQTARVAPMHFITVCADFILILPPPAFLLFAKGQAINMKNYVI
jgi:hypothetical protein